MTRLFNHAYYLVCLIAAVYAALPAGTVDVIPSKYRPYVIGAAVAAGWIKAHWNLFENPDGTPASTAYVPKEKL